MTETVRELLEALDRLQLCRPKKLFLVMTEGCNLGCQHCLVESARESDAVPVPAGDLRRVIQEFAALGGEEVCLTGGEPLTHPDWFDVVVDCCRRPEFREVTLQTNGALLTEADVRGLTSLPPRRLTVQVSLEGASAPSHDRVRGAGSFAQAVRGLELLVNGGLGEQTRVAFTEMRHNLGELPDLLELLHRVGVGALHSGSLVREGRARRAEGIAPPEPSQYVELLARFHADERFRARCAEIGRITALEWWAGRFHPDPHECALIESPYITSDGRMYPCALFQADEFAGRGVYEKSLIGVIREALPLWADLRRTNRRRVEELEACRHCPGREHCRGGCAGRAYAAHGDPMSVEDRCELRRAVYSWEGPGGTEA